MPEAEVNGIRLHYESVGEGPPLLLLHGGGMSSAAFKHQRFALAKRRRVITVDTRAHGRSSDADGPLSYALLAGDVAALLDRLGIGRASIFGWSDGGVIALHLAMSAPQRVERAAIFGTNYRVDGLTAESLQWMKNVTAETFPKDLAEDYRRLSPHPERWASLVAKLKVMWTTEPSYSSAELGRIGCRVLVGSGDRDMIRLDHTLELFRALPRAELAVLPAATHFVLWEQPERVNELLTSFFG